MPLLQSVWSSIVFDYITRQKLSGNNLQYFVVKQLPCPVPESLCSAVPEWLDMTLSEFVKTRAVELTYSSHRLATYAADILGGEQGEGDPGTPFRWQPARRAHL